MKLLPLGVGKWSLIGDVQLAISASISALVLVVSSPSIIVLSDSFRL